MKIDINEKENFDDRWKFVHDFEFEYQLIMKNRYQNDEST